MFAYRTTLILTLICCGLSTASCQEVRPPGVILAALCDWTEQDKSLLEDLEDGQLDNYSLLEAALAAGGNKPKQVKVLRARFKERCEKLFGTMAQQSAGSLTGKKITVDKSLLSSLFTQLRLQFLQGEYDPNLFDPGATISRGTFNCLTATILFRTLCEDIGIVVTPIWEPAHVRCWVPSGNGRWGYLVETTAKSAVFGVSEQIDLHDIAGRPLTAEQLLGKVYYNRGVQLLRRQAFPQALTVTWLGCKLDDQDLPAQNNLRACLNNWALSVSQRKGDFDFAIQLLDAGLRLDPEYEPFSRNLRLLRNH